MKVVDLSTDVAGQWAAKLFAMGGAQVIRPEGNDERPPALAAYLDAFKRIVVWPGPSLLDGADVVFTSFDRGRPCGLADGLAIDPACVQVITGSFGVSGPYSGWRGGPMASWAAGGYLYITGKPDREPITGPENICDYYAGYFTAVAAEAALHRRNRTGEGATIDIATMEAMLIAHQTTFSQLQVGDIRRRQGRYYEVYPLMTRPCRDGYVKLSIVTEEEYDRFLIAIDRADLLTDARFADKALRFVNRDAFDAEIQPFLDAYGGEEIVEVLHSRGVTAAKVALADDVRANPQLAYRGFWHTDMGPGNPIPAAQVFAAPSPPLPPSQLSRPRSPDLPLAGIVVADFTVFWAGPGASRTLADLGARVIWVERPGSRARWDFSGDPPVLNPGDLFNVEMSRNKESLVLDLTSAAGLAAARQLVAHADVVVENNRPGVMDKLGLGPEAVCAAFPHIVYVSLSGYGTTGPWAERRSYGPAIEAASGIEGRTGYPGDEPLRLGHPLPDATGGIAGALAALRGLRERHERGAGGWYDVSQLESYIAMGGEDYVTGNPLPRIGNCSRWGTLQGVYPCAGQDEWIALRLPGDADIAGFVGVTGVDPRDETALAAYTATRDKHRLAHHLQSAGLEAVPVFKPDEFPHDPHLRERGFFIDLAYGSRSAPMPGSPLRPLADPTGPSPNFGDQTEALLAEIGRLGGVR